MRRLTGCFVAALLAASGWSCRPKPAQTVMVDDESQPALSVLHVAHPRADTQLLSGFHKIEEGAWRWTKGSFAVALEPPPGAAQNGARLELRFTLPDPVIARRKAVTLSATVAGTPLPPETYTKAGDYTYVRDVPASALTTPPVKVAFALDRFLKAGEVEPRELGLVVSTVGLVGK